MSSTAILMMNMGGPASLSHVAPFLSELFGDHEIISLPLMVIERGDPYP